MARTCRTEGREHSKLRTGATQSATHEVGRKARSARCGMEAWAGLGAESVERDSASVFIRHYAVTIPPTEGHARCPPRRQEPITRLLPSAHASRRLGHHAPAISPLLGRLPVLGITASGAPCKEDFAMPGEDALRDRGCDQA